MATGILSIVAEMRNTVEEFAREMQTWVQSATDYYEGDRSEKWVDEKGDAFQDWINEIEAAAISMEDAVPVLLVVLQTEMKKAAAQQPPLATLLPKRVAQLSKHEDVLSTILAVLPPPVVHEYRPLPPISAPAPVPAPEPVFHASDKTSFTAKEAKKRVESVMKFLPTYLAWAVAERVGRPVPLKVVFNTVAGGNMNYQPFSKFDALNRTWAFGACVRVQGLLQNQEVAQLTICLGSPEREPYMEAAEVQLRRWLSTQPANVQQLFKTHPAFLVGGK